MAFLFPIKDGETYSHLDLMVPLEFTTERAMKNWVDEMDIPYEPRGKVWWMAGEDVRVAMRLRAKTHKQRREDKAGS